MEMKHHRFLLGVSVGFALYGITLWLSAFDFTTRRPELGFAFVMGLTLSAIAGWMTEWSADC